jgi:two-component system, response regulator PdtaR
MSTRLLIADDEPAVRNVLAEMLAGLGFDVVGAAADGLEAVALARSLTPDVIVMDLRMPRLDGIEATRAICAESAPRIVMLSAYADPALQREAYEAGAAAYLVKGCAIAELTAALCADGTVGRPD